MGNEHSKNKEITKNGTIHDKHENGSVNGLSANITSNGLEVVVNGETIVHQNGEPFSLNFATESTEPDFVIVESDCQPAEAQVILELPEPTIQKEEVKKSKEEKVHLFGKMFKKKAEPPTDVENIQEKETSNEDQKAVSPPATDPQLETATLKQESESLTEPESVTQDPRPEEEKAPETDNGDSQPVENQEESDPEENPVMNFFKTLVTSTKTSKKETATPDATKEQSQKETQPAATITAAQVSEPPAALKGMSIPPPPPPEPPKMEVKGEPAAKPVKPTPKEEPKAAAKEPEPSKATSAKDTLSKFFRPKKVDPSKAGTLEAAAKPEPPPPAQEEKKTASKSSFFSFFKPKVLLDHMTTKVQAASTSGVRLLRRSTGVGAEPKKATPAPAAATTAEAAKTKEEPKAAAKSSEVVVDNKQASVASQAGDDAANVPKKLEKRNSIHLFFKNLGQKRHSTDAGVQTEAAAVAPAAEKAK
ncbi:breast carcinoma-amplified sequence 1 isoform X7 [Seriola aureovittata]|uniref:breast carcinoma-amplified sequence 1 isoform X7 n=1 Tax=Seriola aureovittata TaxID=2871759 RepID=UPI0024BD9093|nr:breast carcinoma-amplified sequence 1 isoform X7 [Seriola aureovittata]